MLENLALVYATVGAYDDAVDQIELLPSVPEPEIPAWPRVDPPWDPLRDHPRSQAQMER
jgi:hypothetical protein